MDYLSIAWPTMKTLKGSIGFDLFYVDRTDNVRGYEVFGYTGRDFLITSAEGDHTQGGTAAKEFLDDYLEEATEVPSREDAFAVSTSEVPATQVQVVGGTIAAVSYCPYPAPADPAAYVRKWDQIQSKSSEQTIESHTVASGKRFILTLVHICPMANLNKAVTLRIKRDSTTLVAKYVEKNDESTSELSWSPGYPIASGGETISCTVQSSGGSGNDHVGATIYGFEVDP